MWTLLLRISLPDYRKHLLRNVLTVAGITLGVALFTATRSANNSLLGALRDTIDQVAGKAVLQVTAGGAGIPEPVLDKVREVGGVRAAVPVIEAVVRSTDAGQGNILILGVDMTGDQSMRDYRMEGDDETVADPLVFLAQPDSVIVSRDFADRNGLTEESRMELVTAVGNRTFTVRGIMSPLGMSRAFGGNVGVMDIYSAQFVFSRGLSFDRIDIGIAENETVGGVAARIGAALGPGYRIEPPLQRGKQTESLVKAFSQSLVFSSLFALAIGLFLVFNAFSVSVTQRRKEIGILRALGVSRSQVQGLFLAESLALGMLGSGLGLLVGLAMGRGLLLFMQRVVEESYGVQVKAETVQIHPGWAAIAVLLGIAAAATGAFLPARAAGRVDPALALQKGRFQVLFLGENRNRRRAGIGLLALSFGLGFAPIENSLRFQALVFALMFVALALLVPTFSHLLAQILRFPMGTLFGVEGRLASDSLVQAPRRTSATVSALMFSLSFVIVMGSFSLAVKTSMRKWVDFAINPDLFVAASESLTVRNFQFPASMGEELKKVPGVRQVDAVRLLTVEFEGSAPVLISIEMDQYLARASLLLEQGRMEEVLPGMLGRNGVLISNNLARRHGLDKGDRLTLDSPTGRHEFQVVGVQVDYTADTGSILIDREVYRRLWRDDRVDTFDLMLEEGAAPEVVRRDIYRRFRDSRNVFVLTNADMRGEVMRLTDQFFALQYVQLAIAALVAVLGIVNSLIVSINERKREFGILRGLGGLRFQVRKAILLEAVCIGFVSTVLGMLAGAIFGYYMLGAFSGSVTGWIFPYVYPVGLAIGLIPAVAAVSVLSAWYPSSLALRIPIVEALAYEFSLSLRTGNRGHRGNAGTDCHPGAGRSRTGYHARGRPKTAD